MKRKTFIGWGIVAIGALAGGLLMAPRKLRRRTSAWIRGRGSDSDDHQVAQELRAAFGHLDLEPLAAEKFIADYRLFYRQAFELPLDDAIKRIFLLSTDFVQQDVDESKRIHYVAIYSPYDKPCNNPFTLRRWSREG